MKLWKEKYCWWSKARKESNYLQQYRQRCVGLQRFGELVDICNFVVVKTAKSNTHTNVNNETMKEKYCWWNKGEKSNHLHQCLQCCVGLQRFSQLVDIGNFVVVKTAKSNTHTNVKNEATKEKYCWWNKKRKQSLTSIPSALCWSSTLRRACRYRKFGCFQDY